MLHQYREFSFKSDLNEMEMRLIARGFGKVLDNHGDLKPNEYSLFYFYGTQESTQEPLRYGIKWVEG